MLLTVCVVSKASTPFESLMKLPTFERATRVIKFYETLHVGKGNVIGYGHVIKDGESLKYGIDLNEQEADALLRSDLATLIKMFSDSAPFDTLLAVLSYNVGCGRVLKSKLYKDIINGDTSHILEEYLTFSRYKGKTHSGLRRRRYLEFQLLAPYSVNKSIIL